MTSASLRLFVMVGTLAVAVVAACGGDSDGNGGEGATGGEGNEGGEGTGGSTAGTGNAGTGGTSGDAGAGGEGATAGVPTSSAAPRTGTAIVTGGTLARSANFQAVLTLGEVPGGNTRMTSTGYRAHLGFVGSVQ